MLAQRGLGMAEITVARGCVWSMTLFRSYKGDCMWERPQWRVLGPNAAASTYGTRQPYWGINKDIPAGFQRVRRLKVQIQSPARATMAGCAWEPGKWIQVYTCTGVDSGVFEKTQGGSRLLDVVGALCVFVLFVPLPVWNGPGQTVRSKAQLDVRTFTCAGEVS